MNIASTAIQAGRSSHQPVEPTAGWASRSATVPAVATNNAVRCHRNAVIASPFEAMTPRQTRGRSSHRDTGPRSSNTNPVSHAACASSASVGGDMFDTRSPGMPTMETGYGPNAVSATVAANPPPVRANPVRRPSRPSAYR